MTLGEMACGGWVTVAMLMLVLWAYQRRTRVAGIVDVAWALGTGALGAVFAVLAAAPEPSRQALVAVMAIAWGARLGAHLWLRLRRDGEDSRYAYMRAKSGRYPQTVMFFFFQAQAAWVLLFALPMWAAATAPGEIGWTDFLGLAIWFLAIGGEWRADKQLQLYRSQSGNQGRVCRLGLWKFSRHPNYFFEWLHWTAYCLVAVGSEYWWVTLVTVIVMYVFLTRVTGIPWAETQALRRRGEAYRQYQRTTSQFFPWPSRTTRPLY